MATATVGSELPIVDIVGTMTIGAVPAEARLRSKRLSVAALARDLRVCAVKREAGLRVVIEQPLLPVDGVMAQRAVLTEAPLVGVVLAVAADAILRCVAEHMRLATLATLGFRVFAEQGETSEIVVEKDVVFPRGFTVAVETLRAL